MALRQQAGPKVFARGEEYHRDGEVDLLSVERDRVLARVLGSEDYRTVLRGRGTKIRGECSCPAFRDWGFCKHLVATALATNEVPDDDREQEPSVLDRIRAHLKRQGADALVEMVVALAERDTDLFRKLEIAATAASPSRRRCRNHRSTRYDEVLGEAGLAEYPHGGIARAGCSGSICRDAQAASPAQAQLH